MAIRDILYLNDDVEAYLKQVKRGNIDDYFKLDSRIRTLAEHGESVIDGRTYKKMKVDARRPIIQVKIITRHYRIHTALTRNHLYLLNAFNKKAKHTPKHELEKSILRANQITQL